MKIYFIIYLFCITSIAFAQKKNVYSINYSLFNSGVLISLPSSKGGVSYELNSIKNLGFSILRSTKQKVKFETGIKFLSLNGNINYIMSDGTLSVLQKFKAEYITVPLLFRIDFWKIMYFQSGLIYDIKLNGEGNSAINQTGLGVNMGLGINCIYKNFVFQLSPILQLHSLFPFQKQFKQYHLFESGLLFSAGVNL